MGTQQQLLIILSVLIVGVAVVVGINMMGASYDERITEIVILEVHNVGVNANLYRKIPTELGGGGGSYEGFTKNISQILKDDIVDEFVIIAERNRIDMTFTLKDIGKGIFEIRARYMPDGLDQLRVYDPNTDEWNWFFQREN
jgi:hypothetical protein